MAKDREIYRQTEIQTGRQMYIHALPTGGEVIITRMWANAQRDGRPAVYRWRPLINAAKFGSRPLLKCRAVTLPEYESARLGGRKVNFAPGKIP